VLVSGRRAYAVDDYLYDEEYEDVAAVAPQEFRRPAVTPQHRPPRVPSVPVEEPQPPYKAEPVARRRAPTEATRPLTVSEPRATAEPGVSRTPDGDTPFSDTDPHIVVPATQIDTRASSDEAESQEGADMAPGYTRCRTCHAVLAPDTTICPNCGTLR
jgi:hypothetical protein